MIDIMDSGGQNQSEELFEPGVKVTDQSMGKREPIEGSGGETNPIGRR